MPSKKQANFLKAFKPDLAKKGKDKVDPKVAKGFAAAKGKKPAKKSKKGY